MKCSDNIAEMAKDAFAHHQIESRSRDDDYAKVWVCKKPGTGMYRFSVVVWPGYIAVHGDVGNITFYREADMIDWFRSAQDSPGYVIGKVVGRDQRSLQQWDDFLLEQWLNEQIAMEKQRVEDDLQSEVMFTPEAIESLRDHVWSASDPACGFVEFFNNYFINFDEPAYGKKYFDCYINDASELPELMMDYAPDVLWCFHALRKFLELHDNIGVESAGV